MTTGRTRSETAIVLLGGAASVADFGALPGGCTVIAADSGVALAEVLGLRVDAVVGDMDSVDPTALAALSAKGTDVVPHPVDKDATDAELALLHAARSGARRLIVLGAGGGRLDHQLALFSVLFHDELRDVQIEARLGASRAFPVRGGGTVALNCAVGTVIGLVPFGGDARGVTTEGLKWPLDDETLSVVASRGVSNRAVSDDVRVSVGDGRLIVTVDEPDDEKRGA